MEQKKGLILAMLGSFLILIMNGCAGGPKIRPQRPNEGITIQTLQENWEDYDVYYSGYSVSTPTAILFDPKDNNMKIGGNRWTKINDKETLSKVLNTLPQFTYPSKIEGPDAQVYGYIYYTKREPGGVRSQRAALSMSDANTIMINFESISTGNGTFHAWSN
jgi:hypothetical protein